jgi:adenine phosphoribosyltransferase
VDLAACIRDVPDFPIEGILFKDITTLLQDPGAFKETVDTLVARYAGAKIDKIAAIESRGFIFGAPLAHQLGTGFVPVRKPGKLPAKTVRVEYSLEYGSNVLEMHVDALRPGERVLVVDDLLATGGSARAVAQLVEELEGTVMGMAFVIELEFLKGREKLRNYDVFSLVRF